MSRPKAPSEAGRHTNDPCELGVCYPDLGLQRAAPGCAPAGNQLEDE